MPKNIPFSIFYKNNHMFSILLFFHSIIRWLVLISLLYAIFNSLNKYLRQAAFTKSDNKIRHWTATLTHVQLLIGMIMYFKSTAVAQFMAVGHASGTRINEPFFFGLIHVGMMITAIIVITFGSAIAKRQESDQKKFKTIFLFFTIALLIILAAIPWPFSPLAQRPLIRNF